MCDWTLDRVTMSCLGRKYIPVQRSDPFGGNVRLEATPCDASQAACRDNVVRQRRSEPNRLCYSKESFRERFLVALISILEGMTEQRHLAKPSRKRVVNNYESSAMRETVKSNTRHPSRSSAQGGIINAAIRCSV